MSITISPKSLEKLTRLSEKYPAVAEKYVNDAIQKSLVRVFGAEKIEAPFGVTANLRDNWTVRTGRFQGALTSNVPYARTVHEGGVPDFFPSGETLKPWAAKKGLNPWAVAAAIKRRGHLIANPFLDRAAKSSEAGVIDTFEKAVGFILEELSQ